MRLLRFFRRVFDLRLSDKFLLIKGMMLGVFLRLVLVTTNFKTTIKLVHFLRGNKTAVIKNPSDKELMQYIWLISITRKALPFINCLAVSIVYWWLLKDRGIHTEMRFGMMKEEEGFMAHAWLEYKGKKLTINPQIDEKYVPFKSAILS